LSEPKKGLIDERVPFRGCEVEISQVLPGRDELTIKRLDWNTIQAVACGNGGVDVADGGPGLDEGAADVEGDSAN
jgi:hypothetical protein